MERLLFPILTRQAPEDPRRGGRRRLRPRHRQRRVPLPRQPVQAARPALAGRPPRQHHHPDVREPRPAAVDREAVPLRPRGMVILAGVTGSGKITTIASMLDYINEREPLHILTIEDPIEFMFTDKKSYINQREVGLDVCDWHTALKHAVRQDPDVILVGEMRDRETFEAGRPRGRDRAPRVRHDPRLQRRDSTINRILDLFPPNKHHAIRQSLAFNLKAVVAQKLVPVDQAGRPAGADQRDHDRQPDDPRADPQGRGREARSTRSGSATRKGWWTSPRTCGSWSSAATSTRRRPWSSPRTPSS